MRVTAVMFMAFSLRNLDSFDLKEASASSLVTERRVADRLRFASGGLSRRQRSERLVEPPPVRPLKIGLYGESVSPKYGVHFLKAVKPRPRCKLRFNRDRGGACKEIKVRRTSSGSASGCRIITASTSRANRIAQRFLAEAEAGALRRFDPALRDADPFMGVTLPGAGTTVEHLAGEEDGPLLMHNDRGKRPCSR